jgi:hypothetical protein
VEFLLQITAPPRILLIEECCAICGRVAALKKESFVRFGHCEANPTPYCRFAGTPKTEAYVPRD